MAHDSDLIAHYNTWETRSLAIFCFGAGLRTTFMALAQLCFQRGWEQASSVCGFKEFLFLAFLRRMIAREPVLLFMPSCKS